MASKKRKKRPPEPSSSPADEEDLIPLVEYYWKLGFNDPAIATNCLDHFERGSFGLSGKTVQRLRDKLDLKGVRQQAATLETIMPFYMEIRERFPTMGARAMVATLRQDYSIKVAEHAFKFMRKRFWSAGVMDILCFDQHDKWKRFGLWFHLGMDPYPGQLSWLKIWWSNRNPKLVTSYYLKACRHAGGIPLITQSDLGSENYGIANCHTTTRQHLDPSLANTLQHRWMSKKGHNIKPEATWSQMRRQFTPGFEDILEDGVARGYYNVDNPLENLVFRWLAIPWLQAELDAWVSRYNSTPRRRDKNKILPHGIPELIVIVPPDLFDEMEAQWAPPNDPVFELTPPIFTAKIRELYTSFGSPAVTSRNFWEIYCYLLNAIIPIQDEFSEAIQNHNNGFDCTIELILGQIPLREGVNVVAGYDYYGGVPNFPPQSPSGSQDVGDESEDHRAFADLTDAESS
ncbi:hypothetical protein B0H19DRAFT_1211058 [Mycena capillaripes]|nr:hypothetical protein B0H19DRAFT_1211058 [Mycena capillaripes]